MFKVKLIGKTFYSILHRVKEGYNPSQFFFATLSDNEMQGKKKGGGGMSLMNTDNTKNLTIILIHLHSKQKKVLSLVLLKAPFKLV